MDSKTVSQARQELEQDVSAIKRLFTSPEGEKVFTILNLEFADRTSHVPGDSHSTAFKEGQRSVVLFIMDTLESKYEA